MGKRLTCPRCSASNEYDVPANEVTATLRQVACRACGHRFGYGFKPEYVTEAEPEPREARPPEPYDSSVEFTNAKERLERHVMQHREYHDRDRDVLLLHLIDMTYHLDHELGSIKRALDVNKSQNLRFVTRFDRLERRKKVPKPMKIKRRRVARHHASKKSQKPVVVLPPNAVTDNYEPIKLVRRAKKASPAQLDREIAEVLAGTAHKSVQVGSRVELPARSDYRFEDPDIGFEGDTHGDVVKLKGDRAFVRMDSGRMDWFMAADLRVEK